MKPKIQIFSNTNYPLYEVLRSELISCDEFKVAVAFLKKSDKKAEQELKDKIAELKNKELNLPGLVPSLKKIIIFMKQKLLENPNGVNLETLYTEIQKIVIEKRLKFKMDTFKNTLRGELNKHEENSEHLDNMGLFKRIGKGLYTLTEKGRNYKGR